MSDESNSDAEASSADEAPEQEPAEPFRGESPFDEDNPFDDASSGGRPDFGPTFDDGSSATGMDPSLALTLARSWTKQHQEAAMLGAFAVGVFAGALLRE